MAVPSRQKALIREKDLNHHLKNGEHTKKAKDKDAEKAKERLEKDNQLRMALELVKGLPKIKEIQ